MARRTSEPHHNSDSKHMNLESYACLWLDQNANSREDNRQTQKELRQIINHLRVFDKINECEQYIRQIKHEKIVLIVSGRLGREIVPRLHDISQFYACYVLCQDQKLNEQWAKNFSKVVGVFTERSKLIAHFNKDQKCRNKLEDGISISIIASGSQSLEVRNAMFLWFELFIEVLLRMHHKSNDRRELLDICKNNYKGNIGEMEIINEFENTYKPEKAIWWYTRDSCFYRLMNKALRVQDFDLLFAFRFFITDIAKQMKSEHEKFIRTSEKRSIIRVYRGQIIGNDELELMKKSKGDFITMNSFLSTSREESTAIRFAKESETPYGHHRVLFHIEINPRLPTKAFADIQTLSYYQNEAEVLIMIGALFRIEEVKEVPDEQIWIVKVSLASEDDFKLKETFSYMKSTIGDDTDLDTLGKILVEMGQYEAAEKLYKRILYEAQLVCGNAELGLGKIGILRQEGEQSLKHLKAALQTRERLLGSRHASVGECYTSIGTLNWYVQNDYNQALMNLKKAAEIQETTLPSDSLALAETYLNLADTYSSLGQYDLSLDNYLKSLEIRKKVLPSHHPMIAETLNNLGSLYEHKGHYEKALEYLEQAMEIKHKIFPPTHEEFIATATNIQRLKNKIGKTPQHHTHRH